MKHIRILSLLFMLIFAFSSYGYDLKTNSASASNWTSFYAAFTKAIHERNRAELKKMMASKIRFSDGAVPPDTAFSYLDNDNGDLWRRVEQSLATGSKVYKNQVNRKPMRVTNDDLLLFERGPDARWRWIGFMGS